MQREIAADASGWIALDNLGQAIDAFGTLNFATVLPRTNGSLWICATTDRGTNETHARKHILNLVHSIPRAMYLDSDCFEHLGHLCVLGGLATVDAGLKELGKPWLYYAGLAIVANCARDSAKDVFAAWEQLFGSESAIAHARKMIPRCISSRWGSVHNVETTLLSGGVDKWCACVNKVFLGKFGIDEGEWTNLVNRGDSCEEVLKVFASKDKKSSATHKVRQRKTSGQNPHEKLDNASLTENAERMDQPEHEHGDSGEAPSSSKKQKVHKSASSSEPIGAVDQLAIEQLAEYSARMNKWRRHVLLTMNDRLFGKLIAVMNVARGPLIHLSSFLKKTIATSELDERGSSLHQLVCFKARDIMSEFESLLHDRAPFWKECCANLDIIHSQWLISIACRVLMVHGSQFHRRVCLVVANWPYKILLLVKNPPQTPCPLRKAIAAELCANEADFKLHCVGRKLRDTYKQEITSCAETGLLPPTLAVPLLELRRVWASNTTQNERINKMLGLFGDRCPNAGNDLISARAAIKHWMLESSIDQKEADRKKWSKLKPTAQNMMETCLSSWEGHLDVLGGEKRWVPPTAADVDLPPDSELDRIMSKLVPISSGCHHVWATCYNMRWTKVLMENLDSVPAVHVVGFGVRPRKQPEDRSGEGRRSSKFSFYLCAEKVRTCRWVLPCTYESEASMSELRIESFAFRTLVDIIGDLFADVQAGHQVRMFMMPILQLGKCTSGRIDRVQLASKPACNLELKKPSKRLQKNRWFAKRMRERVGVADAVRAVMLVKVGLHPVTQSHPLAMHLVSHRRLMLT